MKKILWPLLLIFACEGLFDSEVKYSITGTAQEVDITITNEDEGTSQFSNKSIPWTHSFMAPSGQFVYCSAQNQGEVGSVTVTIKIDGDTFKKSTSEGAYVIASASGSVP